MIKIGHINTDYFVKNKNIEIAKKEEVKPVDTRTRELENFTVKTSDKVKTLKRSNAMENFTIE